MGQVGTEQMIQPSEPVDVALSTSVGMSNTVSDFDMKKRDRKMKEKTDK